MGLPSYFYIYFHSAIYLRYITLGKIQNLSNLQKLLTHLPTRDVFPKYILKLKAKHSLIWDIQMCKSDQSIRQFFIPFLFLLLFFILKPCINIHSFGLIAISQNEYRLFGKRIGYFLINLKNCIGLLQ